MSTPSIAVPAERGRWSFRRQFVWFAAITIVVSWWVWPLVALNAESRPLLPFGPTVAALVVTALALGRSGLRDLLRPLVRWRVHPGWYALALLAPIALIGVPALLATAVGVPVEPLDDFPGWELLPLVFLVRLFLGGAFGEELGWRGFVLPRLRLRSGPVAASLVIGAFWAAWHLPDFVSGPATDQRPPLQFLLWALALSVVLTWVYERTGGSVLIVTLFHGMVDTAASLIMPRFQGSGYGTLWWLLVAVTAAWAAVLVRKGRWATYALAAPPGPAAPVEAPVVVVGSGFAGLHTARHLERRLPADGPEIVLVSPDDHLTYGPLLPNVASGVTEPRHVTVALHAVLRRTRHVAGRLESVDLRSRTATVRGSDGVVQVCPWSRLVLATGAVTRPAGAPGVAEHGHGVKTLADATRLRDHLLDQLDRADATDDPAERRARATVVVVGAGYAGTEAAAQLALFARRAVAHYARLRRGDLHFVLVDLADRILSELGPGLGRRAERTLRRRGVEVRLRTTVTEVAADRVRFSDGTALPAHTFVWSPGVVPDPLVSALGLPTERGRLVVAPTLEVPTAPGVYALGDAAAVPDLTRPGRSTPTTAQHAQRQGKAAAANVAASFGYGRPRPYRHHDLGLVVDLGPWSAVARPLGVPLWGPVAALVTRGYHLLALPTAAARLRVGLDWLLELVAPPQLTRVGHLSRQPTS